MGDRNLRDTGLADWLRRLPHYLYVADLIAGKQVLEIGCGSGEGAKFLADHGAARVVGVDARSAKIEHARRRHTAANLSFRHEDLAALEFRDHSFDAVFVPDGAALVKRPALLRELRRILLPSGVVVVVSPSADRGPDAEGLSFHQLRDVLEPLFQPVRLVAQTPLVAMGLVEYSDDDGGQVALDTSLIEWTRAPEGSVTDYMAIGGGQAEAPRGFTIVQLPLRPGVDIIGRTLGASGAVGAAVQATGSGPAYAAAGQVADAAPSNGTVAAQIAGALQAHAELTRELERALAEQQAYSDELREELEQIRDRIGSTEGSSQELRVKAEALQDELKAWRSRAAQAEGEVMRLRLARGEQPAEGEGDALRAELADTKQRLERVAVHWKEAEARSESIARRVEELEAEVERERQRATAAVADARGEFEQELARAVEQAREQAAAHATASATEDLRSKLFAAEEQLWQHEQRTQSLTTEVEQLRRDRDEQLSRAEAAEAARAEAERELRELRIALAERSAAPAATESAEPAEQPRRKTRSRKKPAASEGTAELPLPATLPGFETERARATEDVSSVTEAPADETPDSETPPHDGDA